MPSSPCLSRRSPSYYDANDDTGFVLFIQLCCSLYLAIIRQDVGPLDRLNRFGLKHNMDRMDHRIMPYWRDADHSKLHVGNTNEVVNDERSSYIERDMTTKEVKAEHRYIKKAFFHKWTLPKECDVEAVRMELDNVGHLSVEEPKTG
ncbi:unnamed protein product [Heligmosomoides polygyrus]|uniref:SHSP domain-containing protein n=1 Tax=Heligmosomoides polygyrus TaxID=6339 RepID=A0A183FHD9_HELPZ|nr:unnamed protein product [Heligmosomoides polygyrus]